MRRPTRRFLLILASTSLAAGLLPMTPATASPGISTTDLSGSLEPQDVANALVGTGVTISNVTYTGADVAAGTFTGGTGVVGFEGGIILSSGSIANVVGPNALDNVTTANGTPGDADLNALIAPNTTNDASVLEFDFVTDDDHVSFRYVFASDEYNEYVNSSFNDVFAFFVNGANCATVDAGAVSVNTTNNGNPVGTGASHPELYRNNDLSDGGGAIDTEMDGLTVVLACEADVAANETNHMKLAIADASDSSLDSAVFLEAGTLSTTDPLTTTKLADSPTSAPGGTNGYTITFHNPNESAQTLLAIVDVLPDGFSYRPGTTTGATTADPSIDGSTLRWEGSFAVPGEGDLSLSFNVDVASGIEPGEYLNEATGEGDDVVVVPTGPTASVTVEAPDNLATVEIDPDEPTVATAVLGDVTAEYTFPAAGIAGQMTIEVREEGGALCVELPCTVWDGASIVSSFPSLLQTKHRVIARVTVEGAVENLVGLPKPLRDVRRVFYASDPDATTLEPIPRTCNRKLQLRCVLDVEIDGQDITWTILYRENGKIRK
jgi:uncharacterized repeat protein (TIGR01451 family)